MGGAKRGSRGKSGGAGMALGWIPPELPPHRVRVHATGALSEEWGSGGDCGDVNEAAERPRADGFVHCFERPAQSRRLPAHAGLPARASSELEAPMAKTPPKTVPDPQAQVCLRGRFRWLTGSPHLPRRERASPPARPHSHPLAPPTLALALDACSSDECYANTAGAVCSGRGGQPAGIEVPRRACTQRRVQRPRCSACSVLIGRLQLRHRAE